MAGPNRLQRRANAARERTGKVVEMNHPVVGQLNVDELNEIRARQAIFIKAQDDLRYQDGLVRMLHANVTDYTRAVVTSHGLNLGKGEAYSVNHEDGKIVQTSFAKEAEPEELVEAGPPPEDVLITAPEPELEATG